MALNELQLDEHVSIQEVQVKVGYELESPIRRLFEKMEITIKDVLYAEDVAVVADVPESRLEEIESEILNATLEAGQ